MTSLALPKNLTALLSTVRERFETEIANNERLKWLLALGAFALYLAALLYLVGVSDSAQKSFLLTQTRLLQLETQVEDRGWAERATNTKAVSDALEERFWPGDTPGLAEAGFERWIRQTLERHGIEVRQVQLLRSPVLDDIVDQESAALSSAERIRAKVIGPLNEAAIIRFLDDAASHTSWVIVEQFVARGGRSDRFELDLVTFYQPDSQE